MYPKSSIDTANIKKTLLDLENEIKFRKPFISKIKSFCSEIVNGELAQNQKSFLSRLFSANIIFIALCLIFPFTEKDKKGLKNILIGIITIAIVTNILLFLLPTFENIVFNHVINIGSEVILLIFISAYGQKMRK